MPGNSFGKLFRITTYGESHGPGIGVIINGCPAGVEIDLDFIQQELDRRKPGQSGIVSQRKESDEFQILSGVFNGVSSGTPIHIHIPILYNNILHIHILHIHIHTQVRSIFMVFTGL